MNLPNHRYEYPITGVQNCIKKMALPLEHNSGAHLPVSS